MKDNKELENVRANIFMGGGFYSLNSPISNTSSNIPLLFPKFEENRTKMKVRIKKLHPHAIIPQYAKHGDAGMDLIATSCKQDDMGNEVYGTGLAFEIPEGYVGLIFPRSSNSKKDLMLTNHVGVIDSGYRGEVILKYRTLSIPQSIRYKNEEEATIVKTYSIGDKIGQIIIIPYPQIEFDEVEELSSTERGDGGFGSTGN